MSGVSDAATADTAPSNASADAAVTVDRAAQDTGDASGLDPGPMPALDGAACAPPYVVQVDPPMLNLSTFVADLAIDGAGDVCPAVGHNTATLVFDWETYGSSAVLSATAPWQVVAASPGAVVAGGAIDLPQGTDVTLVVAQGNEQVTLSVRAHLITTATIIGGTLTIESVSSTLGDAAAE